MDLKTPAGNGLAPAVTPAREPQRRPRQREYRYYDITLTSRRQSRSRPQSCRRRTDFLRSVFVRFERRKREDVTGVAFWVRNSLLLTLNCRFLSETVIKILPLNSIVMVISR